MVINNNNHREGMRFYVIYSLKDQLRPQIFKTLRSVRSKLQFDPQLQFKQFNSELDAQKFIYDKKINFLILQQLRQAQLKKARTSNGEKNQFISVDVPQIMSQQKSTDTESIKSELSSSFTAQKIKNLIQPSGKNKQEQMAAQQMEAHILEMFSSNFLQSEWQGQGSQAVNLRLNFQQALNIQGSDKFIKSQPRIGIKSNFTYNAFFDGCSKLNPGLAGAGYVVVNDDKKLTFERSINLGKKTNNQAEYLSLLYCLLDCKFNKIQKIKIFGDSQLVIKGVLGHYNIQEPKLKYLNMICKRLAKSFTEFQIEHLPREKNSYADRLSNKALKQKYLGKNQEKSQ